jgi:hypothetical protein
VAEAAEVSVSNTGWEALAVVCIVAIGCGTCAYNKQQNSRAAIECAKLNGAWTGDACVRVKK